MRLQKIVISLILPVFIFSVSAYAQYENQSYLPLTAREMKNTFPVKYIGTFGKQRPPYFGEIRDTPLPPQIDAGISPVGVSEANGELTISGKDRARKNWSARLEFYERNAVRFYVSDLDKNGVKDLILLIPTGGNGLAPVNHFFCLTFDLKGRPVPFRADGYFEDRGGKIFDLVDLDRDGRAELLYMNFDDGYWITNFYKVRNARWQKAGKLSRRSFPLFTRFTYRENHKSTLPKKGRNPVAPDLSNSVAKIGGKLVSYDWAKTNQSEDITLNFITGSGKKISASPVSWYSTFFVVIDTRNERKIVSLSAKDEEMKAALDEIIAKGYRVEVYGDRTSNFDEERNVRKLRPEMLWAREQ